MSFTIRMKKSETGLVPVSVSHKALYREFVSNLETDAVIEVTFMNLTAEGTRPQVNKLHAAIREISNYTGQDFEDVKLYVKQKAGFVIISSDDADVKSFSEMNRDELSACIQAAVSLGEQLGLSL